MFSTGIHPRNRVIHFMFSTGRAPNRALPFGPVDGSKGMTPWSAGAERVEFLPKRLVNRLSEFILMLFTRILRHIRRIVSHMR